MLHTTIDPAAKLTRYVMLTNSKTVAGLNGDGYTIQVTDEGSFLRFYLFTDELGAQYEAHGIDESYASTQLASSTDLSGFTYLNDIDRPKQWPDLKRLYTELTHNVHKLSKSWKGDPSYDSAVYGSVRNWNNGGHLYNNLTNLVGGTEPTSITNTSVGQFDFYPGPDSDTVATQIGQLMACCKFNKTVVDFIIG